MSKENTNIYNFDFLPEPILITEQKWPVGTIPLVHTYTLTYNHERYIAKTIEGILMQKTTFPVVILIHEDCSTDNTASIVKDYQEKFPHLIKAYFQEENIYNLDYDVKQDKMKTFYSWQVGKYHAWCEGDDYWIDPLKLQKQVDFLETNSEYGLVHTDLLALDNETGKIRTDHKEPYYPFLHSGDIFDALMVQNFISTLTVLVRTDVLERAYKLRPKKLLLRKIGIDYSIWLAVSLITKIHYLPEVTSMYRKSSGTASRPESKKGRLAFLMIFYYIKEAYTDKYGAKLEIDKCKYFYRFFVSLFNFLNRNGYQRNIFDDIKMEYFKPITIQDKLNYYFYTWKHFRINRMYFYFDRGLVKIKKSIKSIINKNKQSFQ